MPVHSASVLESTSTEPSNLLLLKMDASSPAVFLKDDYNTNQGNLWGYDSRHSTMIDLAELRQDFLRRNWTDLHPACPKTTAGGSLHPGCSTGPFPFGFLREHRPCPLAAQLPLHKWQSRGATLFEQREHFGTKASSPWLRVKSGCKCKESQLLHWSAEYQTAPSDPGVNQQARGGGVA